VDDLVPVVDPTRLIAAREQVRHVHVADDVLDYSLAVVQGTRSDPRVVVGASPRAALSLVRLTQAVAVLHDRDYVLPDDVKMAAVACLAHRLVLTASASSTAQNVIREVMARVSVPVRR
jgi:MoxR-like ATPase